MRAIIVGAGKIGYHIAQVLVKDHHDVVVIEADDERAKDLEEELDVQVIKGNGASSAVLEEAGIKEAKLLVAVTEIDEVNMISCIVAKEYGVEKTVARVRNPEYAVQEKLKKGTFAKIDLIINPELVTAKEIAKLINCPEALDVEYYADGKIQMLETKITVTSPLAKRRVRDLTLKFPFVVAALMREEKLIIPRGDTEILPNDIIFIVAKTADMRIEQIVGEERKKPHSVMILGADHIGFYLAKILENKKLAIKLVEKNIDRCREVSEKLESSLVLHGDGTDIDLLKEEGAGETDVFVCLTDDDKLNLLVGLLAKHLGTKRAIAQVRRSDYIRLMESVGIDVGVSPRLLTAEAILRFIKKDKNVVSTTLLGEAKAELLELRVAPNAKIAHKRLREANFVREAIVGAIQRKNQVIIPKGDDYLEPDDIVLVFCLAGFGDKVEAYFND